MDTTAFFDILKTLITYFSGQKIPYVVVGDISVITWGRIRATEDIDIIVDHNVLDIEHFVEYLQKNDFFTEMDDFDGFKEQGHCTVMEKESLVRVDFIGKYDLDKEITLKEAKEVEFRGMKLLVDSPESLIVHKIKFGADFDIEDAISVIVRLNKKINIQKLLEHARRLGVETKLREIVNKIKEQNENAIELSL